MFSPRTARVVTKLKHAVTRLSEKETVFSRFCGYGVYAREKFLLEISVSSYEKKTNRGKQLKRKNKAKQDRERERDRQIFRVLKKERSATLRSYNIHRKKQKACSQCKSQERYFVRKIILI